MAYYSSFETPLENCNEVNNGGSSIYVADLICPANEPVEITITADTALTPGDESVDLSHDQADDIYVRAGQLLTMSGGDIVVVVDETLLASGGSTTVVIEPFAGLAVAIGETTSTHENFRLLSPINVPTNITAQEEDRTDLSFGIRGSMVKTKIESNQQITVFNNLQDRGLWSVVFPAASSDKNIYVLIVRSSGVHAFGRALISNWNDDGQTSSLSKPQFEVKFQGNWVVSAPFAYLEADQQAAINELRGRFGLAALV